MNKIFNIKILIFLVFIGLLSFVNFASAVNPGDYGLKEGDTISATGSDDPDVYIVNEYGYKRLFLNPVIFNFYGHLGGFAKVKSVSSTARDAFSTSGLFRNCESNDEKVYGLESTGEDTGVLHWVNVTSVQAVADDLNFFQKVFCVNNNEFNWYTKGSNYTSVNQIPIYVRNSSTPSSSQSNFQLRSNFLKNDPTAQNIASGIINNYDIRIFASIYGGAGPFSIDNFAYRFLSAIRMLGYVKGSQTVGGQNMAEQILNRVQRFNNLPVSPYIDKSVLKIIDSILADSRENLDNTLASKFPLSGHFINPPLNEPSKEHAAAVFSAVLGELPSYLAVWSETNFKDFMSRQLRGRFKDLYSSNYQICDIAIYSELGDDCVPIVYAGSPLVNQIPGTITDDFDNGTTIIHEYAHYLDRNIYSRNSATSQGLIDTTSFYAISYNLSDLGPGRTYAYNRPSNIENEFVSAYAKGWGASDGSQHFTAAEDFAESFEMYMTQGKVFRKLAETNSILKSKYDWLKQNVFQGQEYQSGDIAGIDAIKQQPNDSAFYKGAFSTRDYSQSLPNFVWNYKFLDGSLVPKP